MKKDISPEEYANEKIYAMIDGLTISRSWASATPNDLFQICREIASQSSYREPELDKNYAQSEIEKIKRAMKGCE